MRVFLWLDGNVCVCICVYYQLIIETDVRWMCVFFVCAIFAWLSAHVQHDTHDRVRPQRFSCREIHVTRDFVIVYREAFRNPGRFSLECWWWWVVCVLHDCQHFTYCKTYNITCSGQITIIHTARVSVFVAHTRGTPKCNAVTIYALVRDLCNTFG